MTAITFDDLAYFNRLKEAGVPEKVAEVQATAFREFSRIQEENARQELATRMDLVQAELRIKAELTERIEASKHEVLKWMMGMLLAQTAMIISVIAFLK